jgi:hypothetical protein
MDEESAKYIEEHLPLILPKLRWLDKAPKDLFPPEAKERFYLAYRAYSAAVYAHKNQLPHHRKRKILTAFEMLCTEHLRDIFRVSCMFKGNTPQDRVGFVKEYQSWAKGLKDLLEEALNQITFRPVVYLPKFTEFLRAQLDLQQRGALMGDITLEWMRKAAKANLAEKPAETGGNATPATIINIAKIDKLGVLGDVRAESVQTGDNSSIHKQMITGEKNKSIIWKILKIIGAIAALLTILHYLGWLEPIKALLLPK